MITSLAWCVLGSAKNDTITQNRESYLKQPDQIHLFLEYGLKNKTAVCFSTLITPISCGLFHVAMFIYIYIYVYSVYSGLSIHCTILVTHTILPVVPNKAVAEVSVQEPYRRGWLL